MSEHRISLRDDLQHRWFVEATERMLWFKRSLSDYDSALLVKLRDGYDMVGRDLTITVKQMNHIKQVAFELGASRYEDQV